MCMHIIVYNCRTKHSTAQNSSDNFPSYPPDSHHRSDDFYWRAGETFSNTQQQQQLQITYNAF